MLWALRAFFSMEIVWMTLVSHPGFCEWLSRSLSPPGGRGNLFCQGLERQHLLLPSSFPAYFWGENPFSVGESKQRDNGRSCAFEFLSSSWLDGLPKAWAFADTLSLGSSQSLKFCRHFLEIHTKYWHYLKLNARQSLYFEFAAITVCDSITDQYFEQATMFVL